MLKKRTWIILIILLTAAFLLQLGLGLRAPSLERPDSIGYLAPVEGILKQGAYFSGDGCERAPGFPVILAGLRLIGCGGTAGFAAAMAFLSTLAGAMVFAAARNFSDNENAGLWAAAFFLFDPTKLGNTPLILSDLPFTVVFSGVLWLFSIYYRDGLSKWYGAVAALLLGGVGALIRPIGMFWFLPGAAAVLAVGLLKKEADKSPAENPFSGVKKYFIRYRAWLVTLLSVLAFLAVMVPWMVRNFQLGYGFCIDTNTGAMYHQNGAMLLSAVKSTDYEAEKQRLIKEVADKNFASPGERTAYQKRELAKLIKSYPGEYAILHLKSQIYLFLPDVPALTEIMGWTIGGKGTLAVLQKEGVFAAAKHYFNGNWGGVMFLLPLLLWRAMLLAAGAAAVLVWIWNFRKGWIFLLFALVFAEYFLILPGPIAVPRYFLPALPFAAFCGGAGMTEIIEFIRRKFRSGNAEDHVDGGEIEKTQA